MLGFGGAQFTYPDRDHRSTMDLASVDPADLEGIIEPRMRVGSISDLTDAGIVVDIEIAETRGLSLGETISVLVPGGRPRDLTIEAFSDVRHEALTALERVGLGQRSAEAVTRISYGERRQLELALALCTRPKLLFLDEPCAGLSPSERQRISKMIAELPRDITLVMIEHDMDVALGLADRVTVLHRGRVILEGSPQEVQANAEVREVYFGHA